MRSASDATTDDREVHLLGPRFEVPGLTIAQTTRRGGYGRPPYATLNLAGHVGEAPETTRANWEALARSSSWGRSNLATAEQAHGTRIVHVTGGGHHAGREADGLISTTPGVAVGVFTADCVPVLFAASDGDGTVRGVAAAHCGWRGAASGLAAATAGALCLATGLRRPALRVWLGAAIAGGSYEVGPEVAERFALRYRRRGLDDRWWLDVRAALRGELVDAGIDAGSVEVCDLDTYAEQGALFSYRRDGVATGRMLSFAGWHPAGST